jgi:putative peptidoglycan lipid II flippase
VTEPTTIQDSPATPRAPGAPDAAPPDTISASRGLAGAVRVVSGVTLLSRFGGLAREVLVARMFGDTALGSAFALGFQVPNLFRRLFGEGALSAAFIPQYTQLHKHDPERAHRFASFVVAALLLITILVTILLELGLLALLAFAPPEHDRALALRLVMVMLPYMPLVCAAAILGGMLQVHGKFAAAASGPILLNGMIVAAGVSSLVTGELAGPRIAYALGIVTVLSGFTQCLWFARLLRPFVRWTRVFSGIRDAARATAKRFVPAAIGLGTLQINTAMDSLLATWPILIGPTLLGLSYPMDERSNVLLNGAQRLYQFPLGVFGIAVATAVFPTLARHADEPAHFIQTLRRGIRLSLFIGLPASLGLFLVRHSAVAVPYSGGSSGYSPEGVERGAAVLGGFALAVWAYSLNHVFTRAFYAKGDTRTPMRVATACVALNLALNAALIWPLREAGLAWATTTSATIQCLALAFLARRFAPHGERVIDPVTARAIAKCLLATLLMGACVEGVHLALPSIAAWRGEAISLAALSATGAIAYLAGAKLLGCHELGWLLRRRA